MELLCKYCVYMCQYFHDNMHYKEMAFSLCVLANPVQSFVCNTHLKSQTTKNSTDPEVVKYKKPT